MKKRTSKRRRGAVLLAAGALIAATIGVPQARGQEPAPTAAADTAELVDWVVAVVGDTAVLYSEVLESLLQARAEGQDVPAPGTEAFDGAARDVLNVLVEQLMLLTKAEQEGITAPAAQVDGETERRFEQVRNGFPNSTAFRDAVESSGRTMVQYRQFLRGQVRTQLVVQRFMEKARQDKRLPPVVVSEEEIRALFDSVYAGRPRPASVTLEQIVVEPKPTQAAEDSALALARRALAELRAGEDFQIVARRYSDDVSNREEGGDLGWVKRSQLVPAFADAAWSARTGEPVGPVRTRYGYHIIKVENIRGGERKIRHILIRPEMGQADFDRARQLAASLADSIRAGASVEELAGRYAVDEAPVRIPEIRLDQLGEQYGPEYAEAIKDPVPGEVIGPFVNSRVMADRPLYVVVKVAEAQTGGTWQLDSALRERIRQHIADLKGFEEFVDELRGEVYVEVRL